MSRWSKVRLTGIALIAAIMLTLQSASVEQIGPELVQYGDSDFRPALKGGCPFAYLFDAPGISIERELSFPEDTLSVGALVLDIAFYFALVLIAARVVRHCWSARKH